MSALHREDVDGPRRTLPTRQQIEAMTDRSVLNGILDEIDHITAKIETDLEFGDGDDEWASRARSALAIHKYTAKLIARRVYALREKPASSPFGKLAAAKTARRKPTECSPLALELMDGALPDAAALGTILEVDATLKWLVERIEALTTDREDEVMRYDMVARDEAFMMRSNSALRRAGACRMALIARGGELRKAEKLKVQSERDATRPQLFVDASREILDRETFLRIWEAVDRREQMGTIQKEIS